VIFERLLLNKSVCKKTPVLIIFFMLIVACAAGAQIVFTSDEGSERHLYSVDPDTGQVRQITVNEEEDLKVVYNIHPAVSRDGKWMAYASYRIYEDEGLRQWKQWNGDPLYPSEEFFYYFYAYFPTRTYFTRHKSLNWNIYMWDLTTGRERKISNFLWQEAEPQFMSRGTDILYSLTAEKSTFLLRGSKSGKSFKQITLSDNQAMHPQISPDGRYLVYQSYRGGTWDIFKLKMAELPSEREETRLTGTTWVYELYPRWSPDGKEIYYIANTPGRDRFDIYRQSIKDGAKYKITENERIGPDYRISPAGDKIAFVTGAKRMGELYVIDADGMNRVRISARGRKAMNPAWSPDGMRLAFISRDEAGYRLYVSGADGSGREMIYDQPCSPSPVVWY